MNEHATEVLHCLEFEFLRERSPSFALYQRKAEKMLKDKFLPVPSASLLPERSNVMSKKWECVRSKRRSSIKEHYTSVVQSFNFFHFSFFSFFFLAFNGTVCTNWAPFAKTIFHGSLEGGRRRGRQRKCWLDNVKEWTPLPMPELLTMASRRKDWKRISAESSVMSPPTTRSVKGLNRTGSLLGPVITELISGRE